mgnify:CR=1 FL=1|jgi:hypothetical protein
MITEYKLPDNSFMGAWFIGEDIADKLVDYYNDNIEYAEPGKVESKDSMDLSIHPRAVHKPITTYQELLQQCCMKYVDKYDEVNNQLVRWLVKEGYQIQHYKVGGGFKKYHCERTGKTQLTNTRCLVFMTYLNDVEDGGTEFKYQNLKIPAKKGLTLIWPSDWTHTHRGIISQTKEKTIITGWYNYIMEN